MIELKLEVTVSKINVDEKIKNSFTKPFVFYLLKKDALYLNTFVIVDFSNEKITYLKSYSKENIKKIKENLDSDILGDVPHSAMPIDGNRFLSAIMPVSSLHNNTIRMIDIKEKKMFIYIPEDFGLNHLCGVSESAIDNGDGSVYFSFLKKDESSTEFYKFSHDLSHHEFIFDDDGSLYTQPHQIVQFKDFIVTFGWGTENGVILIYNTKTKKIQKIFDNKNTAHGVIKNDILYYSSVNIILDKSSVTFLGPAIIGQLVIDGGELKIGKKFTHEGGFRYTSHEYLDPNHIITIGFPNRVFLIDATTMDLIYYEDIDRKVLPNMFQKEFLNKNQSKLEKYSAFEISDDNKYLVTFNQNLIRLFNIENKCMEFNIPYSKPEEFHQVTQHCDMLK